jgi:fatty acid-binding protein DegV
VTVKKSSEATVIESDRGRLLDSANELVSSLNLKQIAPIINSGSATQAELSPEEKKAYDSALSYLARQFDAGHKDMETITTKNESERTVEHKADE